MDKKVENFYEIMMSRRSVREYSDKDVEPDKLDRLVDILHRSQSAANCQPWHFIILKKGNTREEFDSVLTKEGFKKAPLIIVACAEPGSAWTRRYDGVNYAVVDVTIAVTDMIAVATAEGLGTCWIAAFDPKKVKNILKLPAGIDPVGLITIGYPNIPLTKADKNRRPLEEIIHNGKW